MYSKVDHWVNDNIRVQVKIPNERANNESFWGVKTHKSHGHGKGELHQTEEFDVLALFIGFKIDPLKSKYLPVETKEAFLFIPEKDLPRHEDHKDCLKRISRIPKDKYVVNDLSLLTSK